jgi:hypothetical protein
MNCKKIFLLLSALIFTCALKAHTLENETMRIFFSDADSGFGVTGILNRAVSGAPVLSELSNGFWELFFVRSTPAGSLEKASLKNTSSAAKRRAVRLGENAIEFIWEGLDLGSEKGAVDVRACVEVVGGSAEWSLSAVCRSSEWTPVESWYPILSRVHRVGVDDVLLPTMNLGAKFVRNYDPVKLRLRGFGSPAWYPMVTAIQRGTAGLYVAAHDGAMRIKSLVYMPDGTLQFQVPLEQTKCGEFGPKFKVVTECYEGDWWQAAKLYRNWALKQKWAAKGPIAKRSDYPKEFAEVAVWARAIAEDGNFAQMYRSYFSDVKPGLRWYCWENEKFDTCYPDLTPRPKIKELIKEARESGLLVMPYVNGRLWDRSLKSYATVADNACCAEDGSVREENYAAQFAIMCLTVREWQKKLLEIGTQVVDSLGGNAVYYDQVNCAQWRTCFSKKHPHPAGGGAWWTSGYREAFEPIKAKFGSAGVPITSEGGCEAWIDLIDGALIVGRAPDEDDVPFYPAIYSGYTTYFCIEQESEDSPEALFARQVQYALWGSVTGSWGDRRLFDPDPAKRTLDAQAKVIKRVAHLRASCLDYLAYGKLEDELRLLDEVPKVKYEHLPTRGPKTGPKQVVSYPAVLGAVWADVDFKRRATFAANVSREEKIVRFRLTSKDARVRPIRGEAIPDFTVNGGVCTLKLGSQSIVCIEENM